MFHQTYRVSKSLLSLDLTFNNETTVFPASTNDALGARIQVSVLTAIRQHNHISMTIDSRTLSLGPLPLRGFTKTPPISSGSAGRLVLDDAPPHPARKLVHSLCPRFVGSRTEALLGSILVFVEAQPFSALAEIPNLQFSDAEGLLRHIVPQCFQDRTSYESPLKFAHLELKDEFLADKDKSFGAGLYLSTPE